MAVAVYRCGTKEEHRRPLFIVGTRSAFSAEGHCPVSLRASRARARKTPKEDLVRGLVELSGLFHDVGKATVMFQKKIKAAAQGGKPQRDAIRHEVFSALMLRELLGDSDDTVLGVVDRLSGAFEDRNEMSAACDRAAERCANIHASQNPQTELFSPADLGSPGSFRATLLLLVLTHHRLPEVRAHSGFVYAANHVDFGISMQQSDMAIAEGVPFWEESWFLDKMKTVMDFLRQAETDSLPLGLDVYGRLSLMLSDHIGSSEKCSGTLSGHLANTTIDGGPADSLSMHVRRVVKNCRPMTAGLMRQLWQFPRLDEDAIAEKITEASFTGSRFDWQVNAANEAKSLSASRDGGFFGVLVAGTGSGKTRAASMVMSAVSLHAADLSRRGLRYTLALPLRTLSRQSGVEYVEDLGFASEDVATFVGGEAIRWKSGKNPIEAEDEKDLGSEDRLSELGAYDVEDFTGLDLDVSLSGMGGGVVQPLPSFAGRVCISAGPQKSKLEKLLSTPIIIATIDHLMPAASPLRGQHIPAMLRTMSADLVIDEIDLFSEEDLSAIRRLVRVAGLAGRRVLLMSATMPADIVDSFYHTYATAYAEYAEISGESPHINFMCAADAEGSCISSQSVSSIREAYEMSVAGLRAKVDAEVPIHLAEIMRDAETWLDQVDQISDAVGVLHDRHSVDLNGFHVSVGLIRITRVKHLQSLAMELLEAKNSNVFREYIVLHAKIPRAVREYIEGSLKRVLTRKGSKPNDALHDFLVSRGVFERASAQGAKEVSIVVLSSPVIETGNDVDFDWLIADPSTARSVIQVSGRVNRHRRQPVKEPNIVLLGKYLVAATSGRMEYPGPETEPAKPTGVQKVDIDGSRLTADLLEKDGSFEVSSALVMWSPVKLSISERILRERFFRVGERDHNDPWFCWSSNSGRRHWFRRPSRPTIDAFPVLRGAARDWVFFSTRRSRVATPVPLREGSKSFSLISAFPLPSLDDVLVNIRGVRAGVPIKSSPLSILDGGAVSGGSGPLLDPVLGLLEDGSSPKPLIFQGETGPSI